MSARKLERIPMSMKGCVSNHELRISLTGPCHMVRPENSAGYTYRPSSRVTLELSFEVNISEMSAASSEDVHRLSTEIVEEINRRLK